MVRCHCHYQAVPFRLFSATIIPIICPMMNIMIFRNTPFRWVGNWDFEHSQGYPVIWFDNQRWDSSIYYPKIGFYFVASLSALI